MEENKRNALLRDIYLTFLRSSSGDDLLSWCTALCKTYGCIFIYAFASFLDLKIFSLSLSLLGIRSSWQSLVKSDAEFIVSVFHYTSNLFPHHWLLVPMLNAECIILAYKYMNAEWPNRFNCPTGAFGH